MANKNPAFELAAIGHLFRFFFDGDGAVPAASSAEEEKRV
jgi:hypothetical protein